VWGRQGDILMEYAAFRYFYGLFYDHEISIPYSAGKGKTRPHTQPTRQPANSALPQLAPGGSASPGQPPVLIDPYVDKPSADTASAGRLFLYKKQDSPILLPFFENFSLLTKAKYISASL
jgi:hypothetical protein